MSRKSKKSEVLQVISKEGIGEVPSRSVKEINDEYTALCTLLGDKLVKKAGLEQEMEQIKGRIQGLGDEMRSATVAAQRAAQSGASDAKS